MVSPEDLAVEMRIDDLISALSVDEKASLTAGASLWYLPPVERVGLPALKVSDGPNGVRGDSLIGRRSLSFPCGMAVGSTWNPDLVGQLGSALADEASAKGVHVLLGPTVCIPRTPLAGRTFESFSEDPYLTARLAVAYVGGVQSHGVACCIKHFACNDQEHERMTISAEVDERTLREIHLPAFEAAVGEAGVWSIMTAYNKVNGIYCGEQPDLIGDILRDEWEFDGLVMSDWFGTHSTVPAAVAGLDLEMPGPSAWLGPSLARAVEAGEVAGAVLDEKVRHLLRLMSRVSILDGDPAAGRAEGQEDDPARRAVARAVVTQGTVLLHNDGLLPLDPTSTPTIAVIGPNSGMLEAGGGSSEVTPHRRRRLVDAIADAFPAASVRYEVGCRTDRVLPTIDLDLVRPLGDTESGIDLEYFDRPTPEGNPFYSERAHSARLTWVGPPRPGLASGTCSVRLRAVFTPDVSGLWELGLESAGCSILRLDGVDVIDNSKPERGTGFYGAGSTLVQQSHELVADRDYELEVELWPRAASSPVLGVRIAAERPQVADEFERAVTAAGESDVAVVVIGSNRTWESEGFDRPDLSLPGEQRRLVEAVIAANRRTVVVVNAGSPVEMPWATSAGAVLLAWYPGEEGADALADMLTGRAEPSGRLPITFPARLEDNPTFEYYPGRDGQVLYGEGVFVGYRHYDSNGIEPLFAFGHGLSYTSFTYEDAAVAVVDGVVTVSVEIANQGARRGTEVVQVYVRPLDATLPRPDRELAAFAKLTIDAGAKATIALALGDKAFSYWDTEAHGWATDAGRYEVLIGASSRDIRARLEIALPASESPGK
jgi:beta-glucosidase